MSECERLERHISVLDAHLIQLSDQLVERDQQLEEARAQAGDPKALKDLYRRGWMTGYHAGLRNAPQDPTPELRTRGRIRRLLNIETETTDTKEAV